MTRDMLLAILAALAFTTGGVFMKHADGARHAVPVLGYLMLFGIGAVLQSYAMRGAGLGATYILVLGLEAAIAFSLGVVLFAETPTWRKLAAVALVIAGIALLRSD